MFKRSRSSTPPTVKTASKALFVERASDLPSGKKAAGLVYLHGEAVLMQLTAPDGKPGKGHARMIAQEPRRGYALSALWNGTPRLSVQVWTDKQALYDATQKHRFKVRLAFDQYLDWGRGKKDCVALFGGLGPSSGMTAVDILVFEKGSLVKHAQRRISPMDSEAYFDDLHDLVHREFRSGPSGAYARYMTHTLYPPGRQFEGVTRIDEDLFRSPAGALLSLGGVAPPSVVDLVPAGLTLGLALSASAAVLLYDKTTFDALKGEFTKGVAPVKQQYFEGTNSLAFLQARKDFMEHQRPQDTAEARLRQLMATIRSLEGTFLNEVKFTLDQGASARRRNQDDPDFSLTVSVIAQADQPAMIQAQPLMAAISRGVGAELTLESIRKGAITGAARQAKLEVRILKLSGDYLETEA